MENAYRSLLSQEGDYSWEWLIQVDGGKKEERLVKKELKQYSTDPRIRILSNGRHMGVATTRNIALERALGGAVLYLDDDDVLCDNALRTMLSPLEEKEDIIWAGGQMLYGFQDRGLIQFESLLPLGEIGPGEFFELWEGPNLRFPHPPSTIATRTEAARAIGGWPALPQGDDLGFALSISFIGKGYMSSENVYIYNQHEHNTMTREGFEATESLSRNIIWNRAAALKNSR